MAIKYTNSPVQSNITQASFDTQNLWFTPSPKTTKNTIFGQFEQLYL